MPRVFFGLTLSQFPSLTLQVMNGKNTKRPATPTKVMVVSKKRKTSYAHATVTQKVPKGPEVKNIDINTTQVTIGTTPTVNVLNLIATGSNQYNRVGRDVELQRLRFKMVYTSIAAVNTNYGADLACSWLIFDKNPNGAAPAFADIFLSQTEAGVGTSTSFSYPNTANKDRFVILKHWNDHLPGQYLTATSFSLSSQVPNGDMWCREFEFKFDKGSIALFGGTTAVIANLLAGGLFFVTAGGVASASSGWAITFSSRVTFTDQ